MIVYNLACDSGHRFEGWFGSAGMFDRQREAHELDCPVCGSHRVERMPTASHVNTHAPVGRERSAEEGPPAISLARVLEILRSNTEDVGRAFAEQARRMHYEEIPRRSIRGIASGQEVAELHEEGVEVFVLPVVDGGNGTTH